MLMHATVTARHGIGMHIECVELHDVVVALRYSFVGMVVLVFAGLCARLSILLFLLRLFSVNRVWRQLLYIIMAILTVTNLVSAALVLPQCHPLAKLWNPELPGTCWSPQVRVNVGRFNGGESSNPQAHIGLELTQAAY